jgi:hypothetical protein
VSYGEIASELIDDTVNKDMLDLLIALLSHILKLYSLPTSV